METSRSEDAHRLSIPARADPEEAAAIVAAIRRHLATDEEPEDAPPWWEQDRWRLAGRLEGTGHRARLRGAPAQRSPWVAADRLTRD